MTATQAILTALAIAAIPCLVGFIVWELYRHRDEIRDLRRRARDRHDSNITVKWRDEENGR